MAHYEMYVCLKKATYESQIPTELQSKLGWNNYTYNDEGEVVGNAVGTVAYVKKNFTEYNRLEPSDLVKQDKEKGIIPLREVFIDVDVIIEEFSKAENDTIKKVLNGIIKRVNEDSGGLFDWALLQGSTDSEITVVDKNFAEAEINKYVTDEDNNFDATKLFRFNIMNPASMVKEYSFELRTPSGNLGNMYAIQGMSHDNKMFTIDGKVQRDLKTMFSLDPDQLSILYEPDNSGYRAQQSLDKSNDGRIFDVFDFLKPLVKSNRLLTARHTSGTGLFNANYGTGIIPGSTKYRMSKAFDKEVAKQLESMTKEDLKEKRIQEWERLIEFNAQSTALKGYGIAMNIREYRDGATSFNSIQASTSMLLPYYCNLSIHGISSIIPGDTFQVDYLPSDYKDRSYLQTMKVIHTIDTTGWTTQLETQFRTKPASNVEVKKATGVNGVRLNPGYLMDLDLATGTFCGSQEYSVGITGGDESISQLFYDEFAKINKTAAEYLYEGKGDNKYQYDVSEIYHLNTADAEYLNDEGVFSGMSGYHKYDAYTIADQMDEAMAIAYRINSIEYGNVIERIYENQPVDIERLLAVMTDVEVDHNPAPASFEMANKGIGFKFSTPSNISACSNRGRGKSATLDIHFQPLFSEGRVKDSDGDIWQNMDPYCYAVDHDNGDKAPWTLDLPVNQKPSSRVYRWLKERADEYNTAFKDIGYASLDRMERVYHSPSFRGKFDEFFIPQEAINAEDAAAGQIITSPVEGGLSNPFEAPFIAGSKAKDYFKSESDTAGHGAMYWMVELIGRIYPPAVRIKPSSKYYMLVNDGMWAVFDRQRFDDAQIKQMAKYFCKPDVTNKVVHKEYIYDDDTYGTKVEDENRDLIYTPIGDKQDAYSSTSYGGSDDSVDLQDSVDD